MAPSNILIYLMRRDLRLEDNPIFHELAQGKETPYTHLLPLYVFSAQQMEVSGLIPTDEGKKSPYREARSAVGGFWRCGRHRAQFLAESVWDLKQTLEGVGSGLEIRAGMVGEVVTRMLEGAGQDDNAETEIRIGGVWMTQEEGQEEQREESDVSQACEQAHVAFTLWADEKYFVDDRDIPVPTAADLPDVFTSYRKTVEPLRDAPRPVLPTPATSALPPFPPASLFAPQHAPFVIPSSYADLESALLAPLHVSLSSPPPMPVDAPSAHSFHGGAKTGHARLQHLISSSSMTGYKASRNGLVGLDFSTKLSAWLALGCLTARQVHSALLDFEDGKTEVGSTAEGYGKGENEGTKAVRFELLWRDYMRLCTRKFGPRLFRLGGFKDDTKYQWKSAASDPDVKKSLERFLQGTTGMGLIDASQRELYLTGYTSNRARQNVASFLAKHLQIDWRLGAEWYECMLVDYDVSSNWGNWQYVAGIGNDPRGEARIFNPVKQAWDYDPKAEYVKTWVPELRGLQDPGECFQAWTVPEERRAELGLQGLELVEEPLKKINFVMGPGRHGGGGGGGNRSGAHRGDGNRGGENSRGGRGEDRRPFRGGGRGAYRGNTQGNRGWHSSSRGPGPYGGSSRPHGGGGGGRGRGRGRGPSQGQGGREARTGDMEKEAAAREGDDDASEQT